MRHNALVTGGLQGIGRAVVRQLALRGETVHVFDIVPPTDSRVYELEQEGIHYYHVDIGSLSSIKKGFADLWATLAQQKEQAITILVNNAGITCDTIALRHREQDWDKVLAVNLKGAFFCAQQALTHMIKLRKS